VRGDLHSGYRRGGEEARLCIYRRAHLQHVHEGGVLLVAGSHVHVAEQRDNQELHISAAKHVLLHRHGIS